MIFSKCEQVDKNWLLTGKGEILKTKCTKIEKNINSESAQIADHENKDSNNNDTRQANDAIIDKLFIRLENQSEEIGRLKAENKHLKEQLEKMSSLFNASDEDVGYAGVG